MKLKVKRLNPEAKIPAYALASDAGMDLFSLEDHTLLPGKRHVFKIGIATEFEPGFVALIWDKSGNAAKRGMKTMGGVIEHTYRGEWGIILHNLSDEPWHVKKYDKIAQVLFQPIITAQVQESDNLSDTQRGEGGFGHTGTQ